MKTSQDLRLKADYTGIHTDSQGSSLKDGLTKFFRFPNFVILWKNKSPQIKKFFLAKKSRNSLKVNPWKFRQHRKTFRGFLKIVLENNNNNKNNKNNNNNNAYHSKT